MLSQWQNILLSPLLWLKNIWSYTYTTSFLIHSFVAGHLNCLDILAIVNNASINVGVPISLQNPIFISFGHIPQSGIDRFYEGSIFNVFKNLFIVFHSSWTNLRSLPQCLRVPFIYNITSYLLESFLSTSEASWLLFSWPKLPENL